MCFKYDCLEDGTNTFLTRKITFKKAIFAKSSLETEFSESEVVDGLLGLGEDSGSLLFSELSSNSSGLLDSKISGLKRFTLVLFSHGSSSLLIDDGQILSNGLSNDLFEMHKELWSITR